MSKEKFLQIIEARETWVLVLGIVMVAMNYFVPTFKLDTPAMLALVMLTVSYVVGLAREEEFEGNKWVALFNSRKFWGYIIGMVILVANGFQRTVTFFGLTPEEFAGFIAMFAGYIMSVTFEKKPEEKLIDGSLG